MPLHPRHPPTERFVEFQPAERAGICDTLLRVGPDAPTLDEGWLARDLAAHLVLRERRPDAAPGILVPRLSGWTATVQDQLASRPWPELVDRIRSGPPAWSPYALPGIREAVNLLEFFVHHEDLLRAQPVWAPRVLPAGMEAALAKRLPALARLRYRKIAARVVLRRPTGEECVVGRGGADLVITAPPQELVLFVFGRRDHARVTIEGDARDLEQLAGV